MNQKKRKKVFKIRSQEENTKNYVSSYNVLDNDRFRNDFYVQSRHK